MGSFIAYKPIENSGFLPFDIEESPHPSLQGREQELAQLETAFQETSTHLVQIIAPNGTGKTALLHAWLQRQHTQGWSNVDAIYGWVFNGSSGQSSKTTMLHEFLDQALAWFGFVPNRLQPYEEKINLLCHCIQQQRIILILDNVPADMVIDMAGQPNLYGLLYQLSMHNQGLCLVALNESITFKNLGMGHRVMQMELNNLTPDEGALLLLERGIKGSLAELAWISHQFANHAFTLVLLANCVKNLLGGDISKLDSIPILIDKQAHGRHARRLLAAYEQVLHKTAELSLLYFLSVFEGSITRHELLNYFKEEFCSRFPFRRNRLPKPLLALRCLKLDKLKVLQQKLCELNLLDSTAKSESLYLRPLVRDYFRHKLQTRSPDAWQTLCELTQMHKPHTILPTDVSAKLATRTPALNAESDKQVLAKLEQQLTQALKSRDWQQAALVALQLQERYARLGNAPAALHCARQSATYHAVGRDQAKVQQQVRALAEFLQHNTEQFNRTPAVAAVTAAHTAYIKSLSETVNG